MKVQPWIKSSKADSLLILFPPFLAFILAFLGQVFFKDQTVSPWLWFILILGVDVSHVYGTVFRTYLDKNAWNQQRQILLLIPFVAFFIGVTLYSVGPWLFWRILAYIAVFHFIRQQYGFLRIYTRKEKSNWIDVWTLYLAAVYPMIYWHCHQPHGISWFIEGEFFRLPKLVERISFWIYVAFQCTYWGKEFLLLKKGEWNIPKNFLVFGTSLSWYFGIVVWNQDLSFTLLNVLSHGLPYFGLVWLTERKESPNRWIPLAKLKWLPAALILFGVLFSFSYIEEFFWEVLVWNEHPQFFAFTPTADYSSYFIFLVPMLSLPQVTHYILDGFVWKLRNPGFRDELNN